MSRDDVARRIALKAMHERYEYWDNVPHRGLTVGGRPAMTQIDPKTSRKENTYPPTGAEDDA